MGKLDLLPISQIPFQMFAYRVIEKEKPNTNQRDTSESGSDGASACGDDNVIADDPLPSPARSPRPTVKKCLSSPDMSNKKLSLSKKSLSVKAKKLPGYLLTLKSFT